MIELLWLIPLLPFAGFVVNGLLGARVLPRRAVAAVACGTVLLSFVVSVMAVAGLAPAVAGGGTAGLAVDAAAHRVTQRLWTWMPLRTADGSITGVDWAYALDPLSAVMILVVTGVGFLIHVYSVGYMAEEPRAGQARFFAYLNLFMAMMLTLVLGATLPVVFVGWEGVGLCSYLLIGYYTDRMFDPATQMSCADAGRKAFIVNRVGDMGFMLGMLLLFTATGTLEIAGILGRVDHLTAGVCTAAGLLLFLGACGKSAQIPLYVWLPDAMAGPTPVSALIHAATMVTAGVYVVCRMAPLYLASAAALLTVAVVGALTALLAATIGLMQNDIKKVLAYSTVSQLGYMMLAAGVGAFGAAIFHLVTHAFFKALLFLAAGSVIHALSGKQDIRAMGGLRRHLPVTHATFAVAVLAIAGVPPLAGFFSKDEILWAALAGVPGAPSGGWPILWGLGVLTAGLTAFYMARLYLLVFAGGPRMDETTRHHLHESPRLMTAPLVMLAIGSAVAGFLGVPHFLGGHALPNYMEKYLAPVFGGGHAAAGTVAAPAAHHPIPEWGALAVALTVSLAGLVWAWVLYGHGPAPERPGTAIARLVRGKFFADEAIEAVVLRPYRALCRQSDAFDRRVVDGLVNAVGFGADLAGEMARLAQTGYVRNYALMFLVGTVAILYYVLA